MTLFCKEIALWSVAEETDRVKLLDALAVETAESKADDSALCGDDVGSWT